jgi:hypothetical protein
MQLTPDFTLWYPRDEENWVEQQSNRAGVHFK